MSRKLNLKPAEMIVLVAIIILLVVGVIAFQAWLLGLVLSWFGVNLAFWKTVVIVLLIGMLFGSSRSSSN